MERVNKVVRAIGEAVFYVYEKTQFVGGKLIVNYKIDMLGMK